MRHFLRQKYLLGALLLASSLTQSTHAISSFQAHPWFSVIKSNSGMTWWGWGKTQSDALAYPSTNCQKATRNIQNCEVLHVEGPRTGNCIYIYRHFGKLKLTKNPIPARRIPVQDPAHEAEISDLVTNLNSRLKTTKIKIVSATRPSLKTLQFYSKLCSR